MVARLHAALAMYDEGVALMRQNLRRRMPDADEAAIDRALSKWLDDRPGDAPGRVIPWPRPCPES
jgi:hypothetical protein